MCGGGFGLFVNEQNRTIFKLLTCTFIHCHTYCSIPVNFIFLFSARKRMSPTVLWCQYGLSENQKMPFGLCTGPAYFHMDYLRMKRCHLVYAQDRHIFKPLTSNCDLDLWPSDPKINRGHLLLMTNLPIKFELCGLKRSLVNIRKRKTLRHREKPKNLSDIRSDKLENSVRPKENLSDRNKEWNRAKNTLLYFCLFSCIFFSK